MNLYDLKILADKLIRTFFALETPSLHVTRHPPSSTYGAVIYDIWSAGLSFKFLEPAITPNADIWKASCERPTAGRRFIEQKRMNCEGP